MNTVLSNKAHQFHRYVECATDTGSCLATSSCDHVDLHKPGISLSDSQFMSLFHLSIASRKFQDEQRKKREAGSLTTGKQTTDFRDEQREKREAGSGN